MLNPKMLHNFRGVLGAVMIAFMFAAAPALAAEKTMAPAFVSGMEDLPLMAGLKEVSASSIVFDTPQGRIVETYAVGNVTRAMVQEFYARTLPQLGWRPAGDDVYRREKESLTVEFPGGSGGPLTVRFALAPVSGQ